MKNWLTPGLKVTIDIFLTLLNNLKGEIAVTLQLISHNLSKDCCAAGNAAYSVQHLKR